MRTFELHASVKSISRSAGRSSVAASAYRSGEKMIDERTGLTHDYTRKTGVQQSELYIPQNTPEWALGVNSQKFWNAVEAKENRKNSMTARELEISFPSEMNHEQRIETGRDVARELIKRYNCAVDISWHAPDKKGDDRNHHAHIMFTSRGLDASTKDGWSKTKYRDLNNDRITVDGEHTTRSAVEVNQLREMVANTMNRIAERDKLQVKTEHLSFEKRGIDREPTQKMGQHATQMERRGQESERGDANREVEAANDERQKKEETAKIISFEIEKAKRELAREQILQRHVEAGRIQWGIESFTKLQKTAQQDYETKSKSFWSRIFKTDQRARESLNYANNELARRRQGWAKAIYAIYKDETPERRAAALKERGFAIKKQPTPLKQKTISQHNEQVLTKQYNIQTSMQRKREIPRAAKPLHERIRGFER